MIRLDQLIPIPWVAWDTKQQFYIHCIQRTPLNTSNARHHTQHLGAQILKRPFAGPFCLLRNHVGTCICVIFQRNNLPISEGIVNFENLFANIGIKRILFNELTGMCKPLHIFNGWGGKQLS